MIGLKVEQSCLIDLMIQAHSFLRYRLCSNGHHSESTVSSSSFQHERDIFMCVCVCATRRTPIAVNEHTIHFVSAQKRRVEIKTAAMSCNNGPERQEKKLFKESSLGILFQLYSIPPSPSNFDKRAQSCLLFRTISLLHLFFAPTLPSPLVFIYLFLARTRARMRGKQKAGGSVVEESGGRLGHVLNGSVHLSCSRSSIHVGLQDPLSFPSLQHSYRYISIHTRTARILECCTGL